MELLDALRSTGAVRDFTDEPVDDAVLARILETARFAPSGGNRQPWRVVVVKDPELRRAVRELYLPGWYRYLAEVSAGLTPYAPVTDRAAEAAAVARAPEFAAAGSAAPGFAETIDRVPAMLVVLGDLRRLAALDRDLDRYTFVGGASLYPFVWSILLAAHHQGLGGVLTTVAVAAEPELKARLGVPDDLAVAGVVVLGRPRRRPTRLRREPVERFATVDRFDGVPFP